jgi:hypothetical protein
LVGRFSIFAKQAGDQMRDILSLAGKSGNI